MLLSYHDSVPPTFADKQVNAYGPVPSPGAIRNCHNENFWPVREFTSQRHEIPLPCCLNTVK